MSQPAPRIRLTYAEYLELERSTDTRHEFLNGEAWAMAGGSFAHAELAANVIVALRALLGRGRCHIHTSDLKIRVLETGLSTYPDVSVVCGEAIRAPDDANTATNPIALVEVLSDSTESYDRGAKFAHYRRLPSLRVYILVSQRERRIEVFERGEDARWSFTEALDTGCVALRCFGGSLAVEDVYEGVNLEPASNPQSA